MSGVVTIDRPRHYFTLHFRLLRFLGLGWWHQSDEGDTRNFSGWYLYYCIITEIVWVAGFVGLESIDPFIGQKDLDRFMFSLSFVITHDLTLIKLYIFFFKNADIQDIVRTLEIDLHQFYQNDKVNRATIKITKIMTGAFLFFGWITIGNTNVYGTIQDIRWKAEVATLNDSELRPTRTLPQPIYIPWNYQSDASYISTFVLETIGLLWTGHIVMTIDTFIGSVILHMSSQFTILQEAITTAYDRTMSQLCGDLRRDSRENNAYPLSAIDGSHDMDENENRERFVRAHYTEKEIESALEKTLKNCFRQHQVLIKTDIRGGNKGSEFYVVMTSCNISGLSLPILSLGWFFLTLISTEAAFHIRSEIFSKHLYDIQKRNCVEKFAKTYSYGFMTQLLSSMAAICVVMVQVSQDASSFKSIRLVTSLAFFMAMIIQLAIQCFTGNELTLQAGLVSEAVMACKWERMPARLRRDLVLVIVRAQRPLHLTAAGFTNMDNRCFLAIMKAAYSYYAVLSQKQVT